MFEKIEDFKAYICIFSKPKLFTFILFLSIKATLTNKKLLKSDQKMMSSSTSSKRFWDSSACLSPPSVWSAISSSYSACFFLLSSTFFSLKKSSLACSSNSCSMYLYTWMNFGITTCSKALTLLLVTLIFSSNVRKDAWINKKIPEVQRY